jgi:uncharacterized membrane protein YsdA (DUF1294 family)
METNSKPSIVNMITDISQGLVHLAVNYPLHIFGVFIAWNVFVYFTYADDKERAIAKQWRISEGTLLGQALIFGTVGAYAACHLKRHKTSKRSFADSLFMIAVLQVLFVGLVIGLSL